LALSRNGSRLLRRIGGADLRLRTAAEAVMTFVYILGGLFALIVLIYLIFALLVPEKF
jgi:hypothetical protein